MNQPIPPYTMPNVNGAIGDVIRTAFLWGQVQTEGGDAQAAVNVLVQSLAQLVTIILQREPTEDEILAPLNMASAGTG